MESRVDLVRPYEWTPGENTPSPVATESGDLRRDNLYIACRAHDPEP